MREITEAVLEEIAKKEVSIILLVRLETSQGNVQVWTGYGKIQFGGDTYQGIGDLGKMSPVTETADEIKANMVQFQLSGIPTDLIAIALGAQYQGRSAKAWLGFLNSSGAIIADPVLLFDGRMDVMEIEEGAETATISVTAESRLADLKRARVRRYTNEDQLYFFPNDVFLEYVASIQNVEIVWRGA